MEDAMLVGEV